MDWIEQHDVLITIILFVLGALGFLIRHFFFSKDGNTAPFIKAGGNVHAGGDITVGNKTVIHKTIINQKPYKRNLQTYKDKVISELKKNEPLEYTIYIQSGDNEVRELADQLQNILKAANWRGKILTRLNGYIPDGIILYRDKESIASEVLLNEIHKIGIKIEGQKEFKEGGINIYIGQNPHKYI